ncbi:BDP1 factor, partial [Amia calva]|nr:BDP1 factor [Amia calva]
MMRRSRISVRPFVRPGGRGPPAPSQDQKLSEDAGASWKAGEDNQAAEQEVAGEGAAVTQPIVPAGSSDEAALDAAQQNVPVNPAEKSQDAGGAGSSNPSAPALQRRKRFSAMPNLAKPRPTPAPARPPARATPRSPPAKQVASPVIENNVTTPEDGTQTDDAPHAVLRSPSRRRPSGGRQAKVAEKSGHLKDDTAVTSNQHPPAGQVKKAAVENAQKPSPSPVKMKDSQASTSQGRARLVSGSSATNGKDTKGSTVSSKQLPSQPSLPLNKLSISEDRERILKARKLRELLKQEIRNEKRLKKGKTSMLEYTVPQDRSKMVMRDFIYYLPESNPMKSALEPEHKQTERVMPPPTPVRPPVNEEMDDDDDNNDEPVQDDQLVVPRVKVAEDGTLIIDEESLTVEVLRVKGPNVVEENDPIFERGSTTTYSSFRKANYTKPWSNKETDMFFLAISMVGTDFSMIGQLFPHRARIEIKNKFKKEEKTNSWRIDKAFKEKKPIDIEFFSELLERIRADDERKKNKSKTKSARQRKPAKPRTKRKENKGDPEEAPEGSGALVGADSDGGEGDSETAEKENEETFNVNDCQEAEASPDAPPAKKKRKRKKEAEGAEEACLEKPGDDKKRQKKRMKKTLEEGPADDAIVGEKSDDAQSNAQPSAEDADGSQETEMPGKERKGPGGKPAGLGRGRLQKPQPNLGKRRGKKAQEAAEKPGAEVETEGEPPKAKRTAVSQASKETEDQTTDCVAPSFVERKRSSKRDKRRARVLSSDCESQGEEEEEEEADLTAVQEHMLSKPTRSGRIPKFSKHLQQPEDDDDGGDDSIEASPFASLPQPQEDAPSIRRGAKKPKPNTSCNQKERRAGKAKLVMLRASVENEDDNEEEADEGRTEEDYCYPTNPEELNQAPAFVPVSLRSPVAIPVEVEETMEELEISHIDTHCTSESEHTIYSQSVCALGPGSQEEGVVATENQLDLLVDVIHFISQECMTAEISESDTEINTEAAQTLLTIRHPEFLSPVTGGPSSEQVISEEPSSQQQVVIEELDSEPADQSQCLSEAPQALTCDSPVAVTCTDITEEPEMASQAASCETLSPAEEPQTPKRESTNDVCVSDAKEGLSSPDSSALSGSRCRRSRFSKPVPNLGRTARGPQPRPAPSEAPHADSSAVPVTVESVVHKSSEGETRDSDSLKEKDLSEGHSDKEEIPEGTQKQAETPSVSEDPEISVESSAAVPDSPSLAESRGRRSRFSKPIPNLGRTARGPQPRPAPSEAPPPSSVENESLAALPSDRSAVPLTAESSQKSSVEESSDSDGMKEKDIPDIPGEETHKSDNTPSVSESPEVSVESSAAVPDSPSLAESRGRRSRFSKPIPNLGRTARGPQPRPAPSEAPPPSSVLPSDSPDVPVTEQKSSEEEKPVLDSGKEKDVPGKPRDKPELCEDVQKLDDTPSVSEAPEVSVDVSAAVPDSPALPGSCCRRSRFSKAIPNLGRTARDPLPRPAPIGATPPSSDDQTGTSSDQVSSREKRTANSNDLVAQEGIVHKTVCSSVQKEEANISVEQNQSTAATDTESSDSGACSAVRESGLAKGSADTDSEHTGHSVIGTDDAQVEVTCIQTDESLNVPITTEVTQGALETDESAQQEPTFILTLFEIPPCDLNTYQDVSGAMTPASTDFPPPVLVESPPAVLLGASQRSSCAPVSVETELGAQTVGGESGGRSVHVDDWTASKKLNLLTSSPGQEATASYCAGPEATGQPPLTAPTSSVTHGLECPADSCDEDPVSLTLEPVVESDAAAYAETEGTSEDDARSRGKRKLPMGTRRGKLKVKPNTSNRKAAVSSKGVLGISKPLPTQDETPGLSRVVRGGPVPAPIVSLESSGESEVPHAEGLSPCTMNNEELSQQVSTPAGEGIDSESTGSDLSASPRVAPPASTTSLVRPGRKPRGFLSLFPKKNTPASPAPSKTTRAAPQRPQFNASRLERKRTTATAAIDASSDSSIVNSPPAKHRPSTSQSGATSQTISISATESKTSETPKQEVLCATNSENDEGPTKVSEYFFSDIFTEVDEPD